MKVRLKPYIQAYNRRNQRERILLSAAALTVIFVVWFNLFMEPVSKVNAQLIKQRQTLQKNISGLQQQQAQLLLTKSKDPNAQLLQRQQKLSGEIARTNKILKEKLRGLIEPKQMAKVLEHVLHKNKQLRLIKIQSLPVQDIILNNNEESNNANESTQVKIYKHGIRIEFEGNYLDALTYLNTLKTLPWEIYWESVSLQLQQYPLSRVIIVVNTVSLHEGWIGV